MARIRLDMEDATQALTLKSLLEAAGHTIADDEPELCIADDPDRALACAEACPALIATTMSGVPGAIAAMMRGVYGYVLMPFQPGEAPLMVQRALGARRAAPLVDAPWPTLAEVERDHIEATLRHCNYNQAKAARLLGIGRNTLWRKRKQAQPR